MPMYGHSAGRRVSAPLEMKKKRYGVAISWDDVKGQQPVDLDIQALIVDNRGVIRDAVYYNNLSAMSGAVSHTGDQTTGVANEYDELIWVLLPRLPQEVKLIIFVVAASGISSLCDVSNGMVHVVEELTGQTVRRFPIENSVADVDVIAMMEKDDHGKWFLHQVDEVADEGEHFLDILEPTIGGIIRQVIPNAPKKQRVAFQMQKGSLVELPKNSLKKLNFSIGASLKPSVKTKVDLDISAVFMTKDSKLLGAVYFDRLLKYGVQHGGENQSDEDIIVDLAQVPSKVAQIFIVINMCTPGSNFCDLDDAFCIVTDQDMKPLANFALKNETREKGRGQILCRLLRAKYTKRWELQAFGRICSSARWKGCVKTIQQIMADDDKLPPVESEIKGPPAGASLPVIDESAPSHKATRRAARRSTRRQAGGGLSVFLPTDVVQEVQDASQGLVRQVSGASAEMLARIRGPSQVEGGARPLARRRTQALSEEARADLDKTPDCEIFSENSSAAESGSEVGLEVFEHMSSCSSYAPGCGSDPVSQIYGKDVADVLSPALWPDQVEVADSDCIRVEEEAAVDNRCGSACSSGQIDRLEHASPTDSSFWSVLGGCR
ncbi:unnamed protein product [Polarella glacialis]|uniref:TerD domain-containing protein n=1 Tax=Polarella glacialis TaxID=89957 RepID=A0A813K650_POLGL|nr:unnamed protein product [Polarella glacialis]